MISGSANVFIQKNRFAAPHFGGIRIPIYYEHYFPQVEENAFEYGRQTKVISVRNGVFSWGGLKVEGKKAFIAELVAQDKVGELINAIKGAAKQADVVLPAAILNYDKHIAFFFAFSSFSLFCSKTQYAYRSSKLQQEEQHRLA